MGHPAGVPEKNDPPIKMSVITKTVAAISCTITSRLFSLIMHRILEITFR